MAQRTPGNKRWKSALTAASLLFFAVDQWDRLLVAVASRCVSIHGVSRNSMGSDDLPDPDLLTQDIVDDMQTALDQFSAMVEGLKG